MEEQYWFLDGKQYDKDTVTHDVLCDPRTISMQSANLFVSPEIKEHLDYLTRELGAVNSQDTDNE